MPPHRCLSPALRLSISPSFVLALAIALAALLPPAARAADPTVALKQALTFHASFDTSFDADFSRGDKACMVRQGKIVVPAAESAELRLAPGAGRFGGALHFPKKGATRPQFKGSGVLGYNDRDWSASVSVWLRLDPDRDLEPGYCDPVQIVGDDSKKGFIFLEWSKDETPRFFRFAIRPLNHIWDPKNVGWGALPFQQRPMVQVVRAPFSRETWTHVVFSFDHINSKTAKPAGRLHIDHRRMGAIENWDLTFGWNPEAVLLVLGAAYVGHLDDLAVFNRALTDTEISHLHSLKTGARELHP